MSDKELIEKVAELWIELGGDAEGVEYCWGMLRDRVKEIESSEQMHHSLTGFPPPY